jgi:hypothetical protein
MQTQHPRLTCSQKRRVIGITYIRRAQTTHRSTTTQDSHAEAIPSKADHRSHVLTPAWRIRPQPTRQPTRLDRTNGNLCCDRHWPTQPQQQNSHRLSGAPIRRSRSRRASAPGTTTRRKNHQRNNRRAEPCNGVVPTPLANTRAVQSEQLRSVRELEPPQALAAPPRPFTFSPDLLDCGPTTGISNFRYLSKTSGRII